MVCGRDSEIGTIEDLLREVRDGDGRALLIEGEAGIGKTALLDAAVASGADLRHLATTGLEAESSLPFAALAELAGPLLEHLPSLPEPQARALEAALALAPAKAGDRLAVCAGFHGLLVAAAARQPLLLTVDDAQWLDRASAECIGYASRRLRRHRVAMLAAARSGFEHPFTSSGVARLELRGLADDASRALLETAAPGISEAAAESVLAAAAGNPIALLELPGLLTPEQLRGTEQLEGPLPPGLSLERAFATRISRLTAPAREATLLAAASFAPALGPITAACRARGIDPDALEQAEAAGVIRLEPDRLEFSHPLLRGAAYAEAPAAERRRAHRTLAEHTDPDSAAWHRAAAAIGPDAAVAAELEAAAERAAERGAHGSAVDGFERAARLSESAVDRTRRLVAAGVAAAIGGAYDRGTALMELAEEIGDPSVRALLRHRLALVSLNGCARNPHEVREVLTAEADRIAATDPLAASAMLADAAVAAAVGGGDCPGVLAVAERAIEQLGGEAPPEARCHALAIHGFALVLNGRSGEGSEALDRAGELLGELDRLSPAAQSTAFGLAARRSLGQEDVLRAEMERFEAAARDAGALGMFPYFQILIADCAYRTGRWDLAAERIADGIEGAEGSGQRASLAIGLAIAARLDAAQGREQSAREGIERAQAIAGEAALGSVMSWCVATIGFLELSLGRVTEAIEALAPLEEMLAAAGLDDPLVVPSSPDLVEALARAGRGGEAEGVAKRLAARAERNGSPPALALAARCAGLTAGSRSFDAGFTTAIEMHSRGGSGFELARTLLAYGSRLHRARRRREARERLRTALETFEKLGAEPWSRRAGAELRAAGAKRRAPGVDPDELTAQEVRVAKLAAAGASNREIAAELFLSPKTVEFHLGRVYRKLEIHSRIELAGAVAAGRVEVGARAAATR